MKTEKVYDNNGKLWNLNYYVTALRSDGSWMKRATVNDVQDREVFFANGQSVRLNELASRMSTYPHAPAGTMIVRDPGNGCVTAQEKNSGWRSSGQEDINGHPTIRVVKLLGRRTLTLWYSLEFGCAILKQRLEHETGVSEQDLTAVIQGEPDAALFQVPNSFQEVPPSQLFDCSLFKGPCEPLPDSVVQRMDRIYYSAR